MEFDTAVDSLQGPTFPHTRPPVRILFPNLVLAHRPPKQRKIDFLSKPNATQNNSKATSVEVRHSSQVFHPPTPYNYRVFKKKTHEYDFGILSWISQNVNIVKSWDIS